MQVAGPWGRGETLRLPHHTRDESEGKRPRRFSENYLQLSRRDSPQSPLPQSTINPILLWLSRQEVTTMGTSTQPNFSPTSLA